MMSRADDPPDPIPALEAEVRSLRRGLRDLVAVLSLPLTWRGRTPAEIVANLAEVLVRLTRLDVVHLRLERGEGEGGALEETRDRRAAGMGPPMSEIVERMANGAVKAEVSAGEAAKPLRLARVTPGVRPGQWRVIAGSYRDDFPTEDEDFLMRVTVEQAAVSIETATLFQQAQQASSAKSQFIATMSHELRTPLNAILGYVDLLQLGIPSALPEDSRPHVDRVQSSAHHLLDMIDSILSFSRIESGHEALHTEMVDLGDLVANTVRLLDPLALEKDLALECSVPDEPVPIVTDAPKVRQILFNLVSNAIKFTDDGRVAVTVEPGRDSVAIRVSDSGVGIRAEERERIFEPFRQVEGTLTRRTGGTGLGLSVARQLSELLGGSLDVTSQLGEGSTFTLLLPRDSPPQNPPRSAPGA